MNPKKCIAFTTELFSGPSKECSILLNFYFIAFHNFYTTSVLICIIQNQATKVGEIDLTDEIVKKHPNKELGSI